MKKLLGLFAMAGLLGGSLLIASPTQDAQAAGLINPGASAAQVAPSDVTQVRWHRHPHWRHHRWHRRHWHRHHHRHWR